MEQAGSAEPASYTWTFSNAQSATGSVLAAAGGLSTILDRLVSYATGDMPGGERGLADWE